MNFKNVLVSSAVALSMTAATGFAQSPSSAPQKSGATKAAPGKKKLLTTTAPAGDYDYPYGMAGCGLGSMVIDENETFPQLGVTLIDGAAGSLTGYQPTTAMTSGTSNCKEAPSSVASARDVFLRANQANLEKEAAMGDGPALYAFAEVLGCEDVQSKVEFNKVSQENFAEVFSTSDSKQVLENYLKVLRKNDALVNSCSRLI